MMGTLWDEFQMWRWRRRIDAQKREFSRRFDAAQSDGERRALVIAELRATLNALGVDASDFTDDEIKAATRSRFGASGESIDG